MIIRVPSDVNLLKLYFTIYSHKPFMNRHILSFILSVLTLFPAFAEAPDGYSRQCEGKSGKALLEALYATVGKHTTVSYDGLWNVYKTSDIRDNGTVWDMYSTKEWRVGQQHCGTYKNIGDCINREHSFPKSWFDDRSPMVSDAFHIYPTDGKVNGQRSNFPYGECSGGTTLPSNGNVKALGKLGTSTFSGYSGRVFEPVDEYKGDFARSYFYMAACYNDRVSTWHSDMLANNSYPVFSSWAVKLLLKWHRQDPVSKKETDRNDAVYAFQHNRNPFIDHPELAEHIWGDSQSEGWHPGGTSIPAITYPVSGSDINVGITGPGIERTVSVPVRGTGLDRPAAVTVTGQGFSAGTATISADMINSGRANVQIRFLAEAVGDYTGTLTITSGQSSTVVTLTAGVVTGIPALEAADITETSFSARWVNVHGDGAMYSLMLYLNGTPVDGYPERVPAEDEWADITGLESGADYSYTLSYGGETSNIVEVTTAAPIPSIQFLFDGELEFSTTAGEPSAVAELLVDIDNVDGDITISVTEPFELSTDKSDWSRTITLAESEDRVYLRMYGDTPGSYMTSIRAVAGDYVSDDAEASGTITRAGGFFETFETEAKGSYDNGSWTGEAGEWYMVNAGVFKENAFEGFFACRLGKNTNSSIATSVPKPGGIGTVSFMARPYGTDVNATVKVQYSSDGDDWHDAGTCTVDGTSYKEYTVSVRVAGQQYMRLQQTAGKRVLIDNVAITDYSGVGAVDELYYHSWDAYCRDGMLIIENKNGDISPFRVYGVDGITRFDSSLPQGETVVPLATGLYIVVQGDFSRRVLIK